MEGEEEEEEDALRPLEAAEAAAAAADAATDPKTAAGADFLLSASLKTRSLELVRKLGLEWRPRIRLMLRVMSLFFRLQLRLSLRIFLPAASANLLRFLDDDWVEYS